MELCRVGAEEPEQVPEEKHSGRECEKKLIRHLRGETGRVIGGRLPNQPPQNSPDEHEIFQPEREFTLPNSNIH